jgi:hypothetical protein
VFKLRSLPSLLIAATFASAEARACVRVSFEIFNGLVQFEAFASLL